MTFLGNDSINTFPSFLSNKHRERETRSHWFIEGKHTDERERSPIPCHHRSVSFRYLRNECGERDDDIVISSFCRSNDCHSRNSLSIRTERRRSPLSVSVRVQCRWRWSRTRLIHLWCVEMNKAYWEKRRDLLWCWFARLWTWKMICSWASNWDVATHVSLFSRRCAIVQRMIDTRQKARLIRHWIRDTERRVPFLPTKTRIARFGIKAKMHLARRIDFLIVILSLPNVSIHVGLFLFESDMPRVAKCFNVEICGIRWVDLRFDLVNIERDWFHQWLMCEKGIVFGTMNWSMRSRSQIEESSMEFGHLAPVNVANWFCFLVRGKCE